MINNPAKEISYENTQISRAIWAALQTQTSNAAKNFITKMAKEGAAEALAAGADIAEFSVGVRLWAFHEAAAFCLPRKLTHCSLRARFMIMICHFSPESQGIFFLIWKIPFITFNLA